MVLSELCQLYGCQKSRTAVYHPQENRAHERLNQTHFRLLSSLSENDQTQWPNHLPSLIQAYNNTTHSMTSLTPHYVVFGRYAKLYLSF